MSFYFLELTGVPILEQLQLEEALLRCDEHNWLIVNRASPPAIVMGISGKPHELIDVKKMEAAPLPLIKRFSGGGTVVVDENTLFATFICQKDLFPFPAYPEPILKWTADFYKRALQLDSFALRENDYVLGEKKCAGNAQYIRKNRWLHHTTFLWDYHPERMNYLLMPKMQPTYRAKRSHEAFITTLADHIPQKDHFASLCRETLQKEFEVTTYSLSEAREMLGEKEHRKGTEIVDLFS